MRNWLYYKFLYSIVYYRLSFFSIFLFLFGMFLMVLALIPCSKIPLCCCHVINNYFNLDSMLAVGIGCLTLAFSIWQYDANARQTTLSTYNKRFNSEPAIREVTKVLTALEYEKGNTELSIKSISNYDKELFYRFFEELELGIRRGLLKTKDVKRLFSYYAMVGITKYNLIDKEDLQENWKLLNSFICRMHERSI
ncbi:MAG: hypothetical protein HDS23_05970 [Bacteroides sp.]|nr:hypothetical protein [Bacteroides sp.]MBD5339235.1 hypothetical protein [Bacteroides sp.]